MTFLRIQCSWKTMRPGSMQVKNHETYYTPSAKYFHPVCKSSSSLQNFYTFNAAGGPQDLVQCRQRITRPIILHPQNFSVQSASHHPVCKIFTHSMQLEDHETPLNADGESRNLLYSVCKIFLSSPQVIVQSAKQTQPYTCNVSYVIIYNMCKH